MPRKKAKKVAGKNIRKTAEKTPGRPTKKTTRKTVSSRKRPVPSTSASKKSSLFEADSHEDHRIQKLLAAAGFGSRRRCEELIEQGRVEVDGRVVRLGERADPFRCEIKVDGQKLKQAKPVYLALYKPKGYLCTDYDRQGRSRAVDLVPAAFGRLFLVGRLDMDSEGLILLTNDGALSERLTHPKYGVPKVYHVQVAGEVRRETIDQLLQGVHLAEGFAKAADAVIKGRYKQSTILDITLTEGMNREVRRLLAKLGHKVLTLIRTSVGPVKLGKLAPGEWRQLNRQEVDRLYAVRPPQR